MASIWVGLAVYVGVAVLLCLRASSAELRTNNGILLELAFHPAPVLAGMWAATVSSGLGMILAAPRTLQTLANDGVLPRFLARGRGKNNEPVFAMIVALLVAEGAILTGRLDVVAPVLSMFFLVTYGTLNLVAGLEALVENPSYRPTVNTPWWILCLGPLAAS
jgi:amino acid transporter